METILNIIGYIAIVLSIPWGLSLLYVGPVMMACAQGQTEKSSAITFLSLLILGAAIYGTFIYVALNFSTWVMMLIN